MNPHPSFHAYLYGADGGPLTANFDELAERLPRIPRLFFELDGSLVWTGPDWQIDAMIYDRDGVVQYVDVKGRCPQSRWRELLGWLSDDPDGDPTANLSILSLPDRQLHDLQSFEEGIWPQGEPSDAIAGVD